MCSAGTFIDTPRGPVRITDLREGDAVYAIEDGERIVAPLFRVNREAVEPTHRMRIVGFGPERQTMVLSTGHPLADGRPAEVLQLGDQYQGLTVTIVGEFVYQGDATYDILPATRSGVYVLAGGIPIGSTLHPITPEVTS